MLHVVNLLISKYREKKKEKERSPQWSAVRDHFLEGKKCAACGSKKNLQVHHVKPFHLYPELELDVTNLIVLCMDKYDCHLRLGHGNNFSRFCSKIREFALHTLNNPRDRKSIEKEAKRISMSLP